MKTAIKIGCVAFGTLALAATAAYFVRRSKKKYEPVCESEKKNGSLNNKEFVSRLRERKANKQVVVG